MVKSRNALIQNMGKNVKRQSSSQDACTLAFPSSKDCTVALKFISHGIENEPPWALFCSTKLELQNVVPNKKNTNLGEISRISPTT